VYGYNEQKLNGEKLSPLEFEPKLSLEDVVRELDVDIVLLPHHSILRAIKIKDINAKLHIPKLALENDYYATPSEDFYELNNIDLVVNQGADRIDNCVESVWLPFSVSEDEAVDNIDIGSRINKVVFVGGGRYSLNQLYYIRQLAIRMLESSDLLDYYGEVDYETYATILKKYLVGLSDSFPPMCMSPLKTFEMMSYGTAIITTKIDEAKTLFGNKQCFFEHNVENLYSVVHEVLNDVDKTGEIINNALRVVKSRHLHRHRLEELMNIFNAVLSGKRIPKRWGF
jgi:hypothetical protein